MQNNINKCNAKNFFYKSKNDRYNNDLYKSLKLKFKELNSLEV